MSDLTEVIWPGRSGFQTAWLSDGATKEQVLKEAAQGAAILKRLRAVVEQKFQTSAEIDYEKDASERERALAGGYRKALREVYRLLLLDN